MTQFIPQDERPLSTLASLEAAVRYGLVDFGSADTGHRASFRYRKPFALDRAVVVHSLSFQSVRKIRRGQGQLEHIDKRGSHPRLTKTNLPIREGGGLKSNGNLFEGGYRATRNLG